MTEPQTPPAAPPSASSVFDSPAAFALAEAYAARLAGDGLVRGVIGPREVPRLWDRHMLNSAVLAELAPRDATVADIGSGAGLPGIPLAIARPDLRVTLIEPLLRRTRFLDEVVAELGLDHVEVVRARADEIHGDRRFDVVTSRAVAPLPKLLSWSMPLVGPHGAMLALKGARAESEAAEAASDLANWGCAAPEIVTVGTRVLEEPTQVLRVVWADPGRVDWRPGSRGSSGGGSGKPKRKNRPRRGRR